MENPSMGRTEQFTEVVFSTPQAEGCIISAKIIGMRNQQLVA
jgi:threonylcarbamoyladenosine tRNA methylthiotransferase MtaB